MDLKVAVWQVRPGDSARGLAIGGLLRGAPRAGAPVRIPHGDVRGGLAVARKPGVRVPPAQLVGECLDSAVR